MRPVRPAILRLLLAAKATATVTAAAGGPEVEPLSDLLGELSEASSTRAVATMSDLGERRPRSCCLRSRSWFSSSSPQRIGLARTSEVEVKVVEAAAACSIHLFFGFRTLLAEKVWEKFE